MNTKYLKLGLLLLPLLFVGVLFFLPDKTVKTDEDVPQDVIDYVNEEFAYSGDLHVIKDKGATIFVKWTDPANAPPGDPDIDVYHVLSDPYNEKKDALEGTMHAIILRNNNPATTTVSLVRDTISYDMEPGSLCAGGSGHNVWKPSCIPATPAEVEGVFTWSAGGPWTISPFGQRVFRYTHNGTVSAKGPIITSITHVEADLYAPSDEQYSLAEDEKCTPPFYGFSFDDTNWWSAYPEDGSADYYDPTILGDYENHDFYFEIEIDTDQGALTVTGATLTFPESWNVVSGSCGDGGGSKSVSCSDNQGTPDTVTFSGTLLAGNPDGWKWHMLVDFPRSGGFGVVEVTNWGDVVHGDCEGPVGSMYAGGAGYVEFPIYIKAAFNLEQNDWRWYENADSVQPGATTTDSENATTTDVDAEDILRLRMNLAVNSGTLTATSTQFKLQYAKKVGSDCAGIEESWYDVGATSSSAIWRGYDNSPDDGATFSTTTLASSTVAESYEEANPSALNPREVPTGGQGEWDWVIQHNGAKGGTDYCFRMIYSHGSILPSYDSYPLLTTYQAATWREAEDTDIPTESAAVGKGEKVRLRISAANTGPGIAPDHKFRLQYATTTDGGCTSTNNFIDMPISTTTGAFEMAISTHIVDKGPTTFQFDNSEGYATTTAGRIVEDPSYETEEISLASGNYFEIEYAFKATDSSTAGAYYCFRVRDEATNLGGYDRYPQLQIATGVADNPPQVDSVSLNNGSDIYLTVGNTTSVSAVTAVSDPQGCDTISTATAKIYREGVGSGCTASSSNCYIIDACALDECVGNNATYICTTSMQFFADPTDEGKYATSMGWNTEKWIAWIQVIDKDSNSATGTNEATEEVDVKTLLAFELSTTTIPYGEVDPNEISTKQTVIVKTIGNVPIDVNASGTEMTWNGNDIGVSQQHYSTSTGFSWGEGTPLETTSTLIELDSGKPIQSPTDATSSIYWKLKVPLDTPAGGPYQGTNIFIEVQD